jgi:phosphoribosylformylglycinamidine synthase
VIFLLGKSTDDINSSEYLHKIQKVELSPAPHFDLEEELALQKKLSELIKKQLVRSAHDVSEGGLFVTLAESAFPGNFGFDVVASDSHLRKDAYWFGESQSRVVVSVDPAKAESFKKTLDGHPFEELGFVTGGSFEVDGMDWGTVGEWKEKYDKSLENYLNKVVEMA